MDRNSKILLFIKIVFALLLVVVVIILAVYFFSSAKVNEENCELGHDKDGKCIVIRRCSDLALPEEGESNSCMNNIDKVCCENMFYEKNTSYSGEQDEKPFYGASFSLEKVDVRRNKPRKFENYIGCGLSNPIDRVYDGTEVEPGEFPFFVALKYLADPAEGKKEFKFLCGGSLISDRYVLTAAHCIQPSLISARVGELKISTDIDCPNCPRAVDHAIEKVLIHSRFVSAFEGYDIALIKLKHRVNITGRFVKPICLPIENFQRLNKSGDGELQSMGFGKTEKSNESDALLKTSIPFYPFVDCQIVYPPGPQLKRGLVEGQLCAGQFKFTSKSIGDTCRGDSGGPLVEFGQLKPDVFRIFQYGIVSFGRKTCGKRPAVYSDVEYFIDWISTNIET